MADTAKIAANLSAFQAALDVHAQQNPDHTAYGIGLAYFDLERLGFDEGEEVLPGILIQVDGGQSGNFRVLCDGRHEGRVAQERAEDLDAVSRQSVRVPVGRHLSY